MINMKKLMLYGGIEAESYKEKAGNIKEENKKCLRMYTALCSIVFLGLCAVSFISKIGYVNRTIYLSAFVMTTLIHLALVVLKTDKIMFPRKSIFPNDSHNTIGIDKAVKHNIGNGMFGFSAFFEEFNKINSSFTEHIEMLLDSFIFYQTPIFFKVNIKQPVHGLNRPFHACMMKKLLGSQFAA